MQTGLAHQFQYSDGSGNNNKIGVTIGSQAFTNALGAQFASLSGYIQPCTITSTATTSGQLYTVSATVRAGGECHHHPPVPICRLLQHEPGN